MKVNKFYSDIRAHKRVESKLMKTMQNDSSYRVMSAMDVGENIFVIVLRTETEIISFRNPTIIYRMFTLQQDCANPKTTHALLQILVSYEDSAGKSKTIRLSDSDAYIFEQAYNAINHRI